MLESVAIQKNVTSIANEAFRGCTKLAEVKISDGINAAIGNYVFHETALESVYIPAGITSIGTYAFGMDKSYNPKSDFTIYGKEGTEAETYAAKNNLKFEPVIILTDVTFSDIVEPVIGNTPSFTLKSSEGFTVDKPEWSNDTDGGTLSSTSKFKVGKEYSVIFKLTAKKGYRFAVDSDRNTTVSSTVNGKKAKKGSYKIKVKISAKGNSNYNPKKVNKVFKIKVK